MSREHRVLRGLQWVALALVVGFLAVCGWWRLTGGNWEEVETPSMGTVAPVGSLLWVKPVPYASLKPGDFITFHPPGKAVTYSHQIYRIDANGITTKGVIPAPDPWLLQAGNVIGKVRTVWWGAGWVVVAAPILAIGGVLTCAVCLMIRRRDRRAPAAIVLASLTVTVAITWYRPFVNAEQLAFKAVPGGAEASYVGTGLLPIRLSASQSSAGSTQQGSVVLHDGEVGTVFVDRSDSDRRFRVNLHPAIPWWWWLVLVLACFLPAIYSVLVGLPPLPGSKDDSGENGSSA